VSTATSAFFGRTHDEAMQLLVESREWVSYCEPRERQRLSEVDRTRLCCETMRLTARLTQIMAWIVAQRAIHAGEMTQRELVCGQQELGRVRICMEHLAETLAGLPKGLVSLLERSHALYQRVARLDAGVRQRLAEEPAAAKRLAS
jgi:regulator of CtrA degradation